MKVISICLAVIVILGLSQCKSSQKTGLSTYNADTNTTQPYSYDGRMIVFGSGGGFAGRVQEWTLMDDGTMFRGQEVKNIEQGVKIDQSLTDQMFSLYDLHKFADLDLTEPGNLSFYITMIDNGTSHKLIWSDKKNKILAKYHYTLYQIARSKTKNVKQPKSKLSNQ